MRFWFIVMVVFLSFGCSHTKTATTETKAPAAAKEVTSTKTPTLTAHEGTQIVAAISCGHGKDVRRVEALTNNAGCTLMYSKLGQTHEAASAVHGVQFCKEKLKQVREHLETAGFTCE